MNGDRGWHDCPLVQVDCLQAWKALSLDVVISWVMRGARYHCQLAFSWHGTVRTGPDPWSLSPCPLHPHSFWNRMEVMGTLPHPCLGALRAAAAVQVSVRPCSPRAQGLPQPCHALGTWMLLSWDFWFWPGGERGCPRTPQVHSCSAIPELSCGDTQGPGSGQE